MPSGDASSYTPESESRLFRSRYEVPYIIGRGTTIVFLV